LPCALALSATGRHSPHGWVYLRPMSVEQGPESTWADEDQEVIEFFYWEPQHLGRMKKPLSKVSSVQAAWARVAGLEVATNHILNFYFAIASLDAINEDECWAPRDSYRLVGSLQLEQTLRAFGGFTQADLLLRGEAHDCAIELKTRTKTSIAQVRKYATLQALTCPEKPLTLVLLTPHREVAAVFREGLSGMAAVMAALVAEPTTASVAGLVPEGAYQRVLSHLDIRLRTYDDLFTSVRSVLLAESNPVAQRVHRGLLSWLTARGLAGGTG
jgi:hypothetical protein